MSLFRKKILSLALCVCLAAGLLAVPAAAAETETAVADEVVALIKSWEGFTARRTGGYIGYGTAVSAGAYPDGITEAEADALLRQTLAALAAKITAFFSARGVTLTQPQRSALASLSYNTGIGWMRDSYRLVRTIISGGYTANELASALGVWCHVGSSVDPYLARHRAAEAAMFLYGDYSGTGDRFCYLIFSASGGSVSTDIRFYEAGQPYGTLEIPTGGGYFDGWYTSSGEKLSASDIAAESMTVTARWAESEPAGPTGRFSDVPADAWYGQYMDKLVAAGVISGYADGTFRPSGTVTRAQALKLVLLASGIAPLSADSGAGWAAGYYAAAVAHGFLAEDQWPDLSAPATRLDIAELACAALGLDRSGAVSPFSDTDSGAAAALYAAGIFTGAQDGAGGLYFAPSSTITRAQSCAVICRIMEWRETSNALEGY